MCMGSQFVRAVLMCMGSQFVRAVLMCMGSQFVRAVWSLQYFFFWGGGGGGGLGVFWRDSTFVGGGGEYFLGG